MAQLSAAVTHIRTRSTGAPASATLSPAEIRRYSRQLILPEVGMEGQCRLKAARVLLVGAGGLGSPIALYLAAAGVGTLGMVDSDVVDETNLQRQILHFTDDVGRSKLASAAAKVRAINPNVLFVPHETRLTSANALEILGGYDLVIDGTDNYPARYLVNDACVLLGKPNVYGSIFRFEGQLSLFDARVGPCYRCLHPEPPPPGLVPSCAEAGVLGVLPGLIGLLQATEAVKYIIGTGESMVGRLLLVDALAMQFREVRLPRDPTCPICGDRPTIRQLVDYEAFCGPAVGREAPSPEARDGQITVEELDALVRAGAPVAVIDVREPKEWEICHLDFARLIPFDAVVRRAAEIPRDREVVIFCRSGARSQRAIDELHRLGYTNLRNLSGGILAWAERIDPALPRY